MTVIEISRPRRESSRPQPRAAAPVDMALNHGTYCSERCLDVLRRYASPMSLRIYPDADNRDLRRALAEHVGVGPEEIFVANGSGPILKTCVPLLIERQIKRSPARVVRHLLRMSSYPIITPELTYSKVPAGALRTGLGCELLPLDPTNGFALDPGLLEARLRRRAGFVYLVNPNNPTGNLLVETSQLEPLIARHPESIFMIDEAYIHYVTASAQPKLAPLVRRYENLIVLRSFSFAFGLAAARVGFAIASRSLVESFEQRVTPHRVSQISADLVMESLRDRGHLDFVRRRNAEERARLIRGLRESSLIDVYESEANFVFCRFRDARTAKPFHDALLKRGVKIKIFEPLPTRSYGEYFRVTVGLPEENTFFLEQAGPLLK